MTLTANSAFHSKGGKDVAFGGTFNHTLDAKKRLIIPAKFREELGDSFIICKAPEKALFAYSNERWNEISEGITESDDRNTQRLIYSTVAYVEFDKQGRITIPQNLCEYAGLIKEVSVAGVGKRVEIWDRKTYEDLLDEIGEKNEGCLNIHF